MAMGMNTYLMGCYYYVLTYFLGCGYDVIIRIPNDSNNILYSNDIVNDSGVPSVCKTCTNSMTLTHFIPSINFPKVCSSIMVMRNPYGCANGILFYM